jgi:hypothetical protein
MNGGCRFSKKEGEKLEFGGRKPEEKKAAI